MSTWGTLETFGAYLVDSGDHLLGGNSDFASTLEVSTADVGPAGNMDTSPEAQAAAQASQQSDIQSSEATVLAAQNAQLGLPPGGLLSLIPTWAWWAGGGVLAIVVLTQISPFVRLFTSSDK